MKRILITGGCGYIGSRLALALDKPEYKIRIVDFSHPEKRNINFPKNFEFFVEDLGDKDHIRKYLKDVDVIAHFAADIGPLGYMHDHQAKILANNMAVDSTLYSEAVKAGVKSIVYASSSMVFQHALDYPYKESDLIKTPTPTNVYGFSKLAGEYFCQSFYNQHGLKYSIIRYHNVYGPGEDSKGSTPADIHVISALIEKVLSGQYPLELIGGEDATRPFTYIDDAVEITKRVVEAVVRGDAKILNNDFNIGPREATKIVDLAMLIWKLLGDGREFKYTVQKTKFDTSVRREMDPTKIETLLGWKPTIKLENGILKTPK